MSRLSLPTHGALELLTGVSLIAAPFLLGFDATGMVAAMAAGSVLVGLGLNDRMPITTHQAADTALAAALIAAAVALAGAGEDLAAGVMAATAAVELALGAATRWTRRV
jgi:hypothetical protein